MVACNVESEVMRLWGRCGPELVHRRAVSVEAGGFLVTVTVTVPGDEPLRPCAAEVLGVVLELCERWHRRVPCKEVIEELDSRKPDDPWGHSTIRAALADLVARGFLINPHDGHGYGPPEPPGLAGMPPPKG